MTETIQSTKFFNKNTKYYANHKNYAKNIRCNNCGQMGHFSKNCSKPITSYGIVLININCEEKEKIYECLNITYKYDSNKNESLHSEFSINKTSQEIFCKSKDLVQFLMICRKHSIGYMEFLRGRYKINDIDGIQSLFKQMLPNEIKKISTLDFAELWDDMWSNSTREKYSPIVDSETQDDKDIDSDMPKKSYHHDFLIAQKKFEKIKYAKNMQGIFPLEWYIKKTKTLYTINEWGFPKGRKNFKETNLECARREFCEETGLLEVDFKVFDNIFPIEEVFIGTDGVIYKYVYYVAGLTNNAVKFDIQKLSDLGEVGDIGWFNYDEAFNNIRPYHTSRLHILTNFHLHLLNLLMKTDKWINLILKAEIKKLNNKLECDVDEINCDVDEINSDDDDNNINMNKFHDRTRITLSVSP